MNEPKILSDDLNPPVKLWNDDDKEYKEYFEGKDVVIPAHGYIPWRLLEASQFRGQFTPMRQRLPNGEKVERIKKLRIERISTPEVAKMQQRAETEIKNKCMLCGEVARSSAGLAAHMRFRHPNAENLKEPEDDSKRTGNILP